ARRLVLRDAVLYPRSSPLILPGLFRACFPFEIPRYLLRLSLFFQKSLNGLCPLHSLQSKLECRRGKMSFFKCWCCSWKSRNTLAEVGSDRGQVNDVDYPISVDVRF